jgi:hypothetical protein
MRAGNEEKESTVIMRSGKGAKLMPERDRNGKSAGNEEVPVK